MKLLMQRVYGLFLLFGFDPRKTINSIMALPNYFRDFLLLRSQEKFTARKFSFSNLSPCLQDGSSQSGSVGGHYFHQDLLVARRVHLNKPTVHVDVGSRVDGFVGHVASFRTITVFDIRPLSLTIPNITFVQADLMMPLNVQLIDSCDSLSCLHALEHFGLGRYGDSVNYDGYLAALANLNKVLKKSGKFYLSVPIGPQRIVFNAHRVFSLSYLQECFAGKYNIDHFSFVDDDGNLHENVAIDADSMKNSFGCFYGCGIFEMTKL